MKRVLKGLGLVLGALVLLVAVFLAYAYFSAGGRMNKTYDIAVHPLSIPAPDSAVLAEGRHYVQIHACTECHGEDLGGRVMADAPPFLVVASNLTPGQGGIGAEYTDEDWIRAIRHGVRPNGKSLLIMPSAAFNNINAHELSRMIAYLKQLPAVDRELDATELRLVGHVVLTVSGPKGPLNVERVDHSRPPADGPESGPTVAYGRYLTSVTCTDCHGADLRGAPHPDPDGLAAPSLLAAATWPYEHFANTLRTGTTPDGRQLNPKWMPWKSFRHMNDDELTALHVYLRTLLDEERAAAE